MFTTPILATLLLSSGYQVVTEAEVVAPQQFEDVTNTAGITPSAQPGTTVSFTGTLPKGESVSGGDVAPPDNPWTSRFQSKYNNIIDEAVTKTGVIPAGKTFYWIAVSATVTTQEEKVRKTGGKNWVLRDYKKIDWQSGDVIMVYSN